MKQRFLDHPPVFSHEGQSRYLDGISDNDSRDPYRARHKYVEPAVCSECGVVYVHGRWRWDVAPSGAQHLRCPACERAHDRKPAGHLTLDGAFVEQHRDQLLALLAHVEAQEKAEHPLNRILSIEQGKERVVVHTSDIHLPRRIGEALCKAHHGHLDLSYGEREYCLFAHWRG